MGCLPSKHSTHVAVVHPLNNKPESSTSNHHNREDTTDKNQDKTMFSIENLKQKDTEAEIENERSLKSQKIEESERERKTDVENKENITEVVKKGESSKKDADENDDDDETEEGNEEKPKKKATKNLTEEEIDQKWKESIETLQEHIEFMTTESNREKNEDGDYSVKFRNTILWIFKIHFNLKEAPYEVNKKYKKEVYKLLTTSGTITIVCDVSRDILKSGYRYETGEVIVSRMKPLLNSLLLLINFSDSNPEDTHVIVDHPQYLETLGEKLSEFEQKGFASDAIKESNRDFMVLNKILSILHNIGMADQNHQKLHSHNFVPLLKPYLESPEETVSLSSLATLADIINEEESEILQTNPNFLNSLMNRLRKAMAAKTRREAGWSVCELCRTIRRIARNDANKKALVEHKSAEILVNVAAAGYVEEQREAVGALRTLSFDKSNQQLFVSNTDLGVIDTFISLRSSPDKEVRKACEGALWTLRDLLSKHERYKDSVKNIMSRAQSTEGQGHVMISYQWSCQAMMIQIKDILKANGFKVWMDIEDMAGSTLHAMAAAVENASVVLLCYSQKYKDSDNCRAEAEYAFQLKKPIIPLKMEQNFKPDGWLGFIIGSKLFFDFSGKYSFESKMEGLLRELHAKLGGEDDTPDHLDLTIPKAVATVGHHPEPNPIPQKQTAAASLAPVPTNTEVVKKWTNVQVIQWLDKHTLDRGKFSKLTGIEIAFLQIVRKESPDFFYKSLTDMLKITDLLTMSKFVFALEDTNI